MSSTPLVIVVGSGTSRSVMRVKQAVFQRDQADEWTGAKTTGY